MTSTLSTCSHAGRCLSCCGKGGPRIGHTGEALVAQMPERFLPLGARRLHLPLQRRADPLLALRRAHHDPAFARRGLRGRRPEQVALLLPGVVGDLSAPPFASVEVSGTRLIQRTSAVFRRATFAAL